MVDEKEELPDDYRVYQGFWYLANGIPVRSPLGGTVADFKKFCGMQHITRCDAVARRLPLT